MKISKKEKRIISKKNDELNKIKPILKKEFIGIDDAIDQIVDSIRPYYIFPKSLKRPLVINIFGLTGTGKTKLVERLIDLLNLKHKFFQFDVGDYAKNSSDWQMKETLSTSVRKTDDKDLVFSFDEFQLGRTIDEKGAEVDRQALRPMWEMIDSGVIRTSSYHSGTSAFEVYASLRMCLMSGVKVHNGVVVDGVDKFNSIMYEEHRPKYLKPINFSEVSEYVEMDGKKVLAKDVMFQSCDYNQDTLKKPYFINQSSFHTLYRSNPDLFDNIRSYEQHRDMFKMNINDLLPFIHDNFIARDALMVKNDYSQSLIFVIGNIDEAYAMTHSSNPDADADAFYEHTLKITVPKMKDALSTRFRMEQIGRLGNNIVIYPALNSESYRKIIDLHLGHRADYFKEKFGIELSFTQSLKDIIYKEAVFPTQGVRPVLSTFNSFIDSYISKIISDLILNSPNTNKMTWDFNYEKSEHVFLYDNESMKYNVKLHIENLRKSDKSEEQLYTAAHESGHAILALAALKLVPKMVMSKTASTAEGFCRTELPEIITRGTMYNDIILCLGGREAELALFGEENLSNGASSDLRKATQMAVTMVKIYGMGRDSFQLQNADLKSHCIDSEISAHSAEQEAIEIFNKAQADAKRMIKEHMSELIELTQHLAINSKIEYDELKALADKWGMPVKNKATYYDFKGMLASRSTNKTPMKKPVPPKSRTIRKGL